MKHHAVRAKVVTDFTKFIVNCFFEDFKIIMLMLCRPRKVAPKILRREEGHLYIVKTEGAPGLTLEGPPAEYLGVDLIYF